MTNTMMNGMLEAGKPHDAIGKNAIGMLAVVLGVVCAAQVGWCGVFDDAHVWWRGGCDFNGDGVFQADEFIDSVHAKSDADHQGVTLSGDGAITFVEDDVPSQWCGVTNRWPTLKFAQDGTTDTELSVKPPLKGLSASSTLTFHARFKWDGTFTSNARPGLFAYGSSWSGYRGVDMQIIKRSDADTYCFRTAVGRNQAERTEFTIEPDTWYDVFMQVEDTTPSESYSYTCVSIHLISSKATHTDKWTYYSRTPSSSKLRSLQLLSTDAVRLFTGFRGQVAQFALWNRCLSEDERYEVSAAPGYAPDLLRIGRDDGSNGEFAASGATSETTFAYPGLWDKIPFALTVAQPRLDATFVERGNGAYGSKKGMSGFAYMETHAQVLYVKTAADSSTCRVSLLIDGQPIGNAKKSRRWELKPGVAMLIDVPALSIASHTLSIIRSDDSSGDVVLDYVQIGGSYLVGDRVGTISSDDAQYKETAVRAPYPLALGTPIESMKIAVDSESKTNDDSVATASFCVDMPMRMNELGYTYYVTPQSAKGNVAAQLYLYVNGKKIGALHGNAGETLYEHTIQWIEIPANTFVTGRNTLKLYYEPTQWVSGFWVSLRGHQLVPGASPVVPCKNGLFLIFK